LLLVVLPMMNVHIVAEIIEPPIVLLLRLLGLPLE
jgi:hypothetical protein